MWRLPEPGYDVASAVGQGGRDYQEDAIVTDFPVDSPYGYAILADGMGGHAAGDVASRTVIAEVFKALKFAGESLLDPETDIRALLNDAAAAANGSTRAYVKTHPQARGMGATLVSAVFVRNRLHWLSIGDSPLYLFRDGALKQLNEDHSMAPQIDFMVKAGMMDAETGKNHPNRNCLTSVIMGDTIAKTDCPVAPFDTRPGDIFIVSSDGLQYLEDRQIEKIVQKNRRKRSSEIVRQLVRAINTLNDPNQDNVSFSVIKVNSHIMQSTGRSAIGTAPLVAANEPGRARADVAARRNDPGSRLATASDLS
ncbi:MAG: serine/threonine-protein phosphatase [Rhodobacteraceae bacterium]|nr:serine/threonine-protein phosphatase [Paracoccaceae bacterium]